ncbi:putative zinc-type alcohol dehydrogenase-like protein YbdR [Hypsizygus marmoreus]|uniref:Zinc-type alcohol dehydrogenase-like protein YbdR n=1 Tax=Hypsizygus marmoreus TaxID=39966 RepID=A0A369J9S9_HYPMA|nr:putative zinc-type alcohol dehydrogenase-like protein YbdR [Hypsizygus marmoreus]
MVLAVDCSRDGWTGCYPVTPHRFKTQGLSPNMQAVRWHPPSYDIRVETIPTPEIKHPDDAIVKVKLAALCGSDLHIYRGHAGVDKIHTCGHEFIGEVVALGSSYGSNVEGRPKLYSTLKVGDKVVSPFTVNCGECHVCRLGYTARCPEGALFGSPALEGGQAQYVRVPKAGGTLFNLSNPDTWSSALSSHDKEKALTGLSDSSLLMLADILPTGVFAATQAVNHPKVLPVVTGRPWPQCLSPEATTEGNEISFTPEDRILTIAVIGLGPVGICATIGLLDVVATRQIPYRIVAIDLLEARREKMKAVFAAIDPSGKGDGEFVVLDMDAAKAQVKKWTGAVGCTAILEVVGHADALSAAYDLVRAFGVIVSVGVHGAPPMPFTGRQLYNKNVSFDFGRCPARAMFPPAFDLLVKRQDVFGGVGQPASLIDRIVNFEEATESYRAFDKGEVGKVIFSPWK